MIYIINFVCLALLMMIWSNSSWLDRFIKFALFGLVCANAFYALQAYGYLVRV